MKLQKKRVTRLAIVILIASIGGYSMQFFGFSWQARLLVALPIGVLYGIWRFKELMREKS